MKNTILTIIVIALLFWVGYLQCRIIVIERSLIIIMDVTSKEFDQQFSNDSSLFVSVKQLSDNQNLIFEITKQTTENLGIISNILEDQ